MNSMTKQEKEVLFTEVWKKVCSGINEKIISTYWSDNIFYTISINESHTIYKNSFKMNKDGEISSHTFILESILCD